MRSVIVRCVVLLATEWCIRAGSAADTARATRALKTQAAYFVEASATLSRQSPIHDALWDGVATIGAPMTM